MGELGTRYKCFKCETKFYDLGRPLPLCPSCGEDQNNRETRPVVKRRKKRSSFKAEPDIHLVPGEREDLMDHDEHEDHEHDDHESQHEVNGEKEEESDHEEDDPLEDKDRGGGQDEDGYRPD